MPVAAFDFDHTIIDVNSDTFINKIISFKPNHKFGKEIESNKCWTIRMNLVFNELHSNHKITSLDYINCLKEIKINESMLKLLRLLSEKHYKLIIVSDANTFFIETILEQNNIANLFNKQTIFTNHAEFNNDGCLIVKRFNEIYNENGEPFKCSTKICTENICKGTVLRDYLNKIEIDNNNVPLIYVGDGNNDYCPGRLLGINDFFCVKNDHSLAKLLKNEEYKKEIKSKLIYWSDANEIISQIFN